MINPLKSGFDQGLTNFMSSVAGETTEQSKIGARQKRNFSPIANPTTVHDAHYVRPARLVAEPCGQDLSGIEKLVHQIFIVSEGSTIK